MMAGSARMASHGWKVLPKDIGGRTVLCYNIDESLVSGSKPSHDEMVSLVLRASVTIVIRLSVHPLNV